MLDFSESKWTFCSKKKKKKRRETKKSKTVKNKKVKKQTEKFLNWWFFFLVFVILFVSFCVFLLLLFYNNYKDWEKEFLNSDVLIVDFKEFNVDLENKIQEYNENKREYSFIEFTKEESLFLFSKSLNESLPDLFEIEKTGLTTSLNNWEFFVKGKFRRYELPWLTIAISKENVQSVNLQIDDILIGNISLKNLNSSILQKANNGLSHAIKLINDGNFAGRIFENIELGEEGLVIKSRNISF